MLPPPTPRSPPSDTTRLWPQEPIVKTKPRVFRNRKFLKTARTGMRESVLHDRGNVGREPENGEAGRGDVSRSLAGRLPRTPDVDWAVVSYLRTAVSGSDGGPHRVRRWISGVRAGLQVVAREGCGRSRGGGSSGERKNSYDSLSQEEGECLVDAELTWEGIKRAEKCMTF
ncbi:hypothetical protein C7212DRAFT_345595 [Tuber magnatum]|uniref:Uncharacterized protein n=1 Tax=Tuber magnatum TaxID=42249 RepID=A0A317SKX1_9PEZI|nr:hypothetical protein C7212DRAFT_345595 [Tuber magnatum]